MTTKSLRKLAESRGCEFWLDKHAKIHHHKIYADGSDYIPIEPIHLTEASHAKKLSDALLVAAEIIEIQNEALVRACDTRRLRDVSVLACSPPKNGMLWEVQIFLNMALDKAKEMLEKIE